MKKLLFISALSLALAVRANPLQSFTIAWDSVTTATDGSTITISSYRIYEQVNATNSLVGVTTNTSFAMMNIDRGVTHTYYVTATLGTNESVPSNLLPIGVITLMPKAPANLKVQQ